MMMDPQISKSQPSEDVGIMHRNENSSDCSSSSDRSPSAPSEKSCATKDEPFTHQETRAVNKSKMIVYFVLAVVAAVVGALTYKLTLASETSTFQTEFVAFANDVADNADHNANLIMNQLHSFSTMFTSFSLSSNATWPFVTFPQFDLHARETMDQTGVDAVSFSPVVAASQVADWEEYAWAHQDWIEESFKYYDATEKFEPGNISKSIYRHKDSEDSRELSELEQNFAVPLWQVSPMPKNASFINVDLHSVAVIRQGIDDSFEVKHKVLTRPIKFHVIEDYKEADPESLVIQPVFNDFFRTSEIVGFLTADIAWHTFFQRVLPHGIDGIVVEVDMTCGESFVYRINGPAEEFLGFGQYHDAAYDSTKRSYDFAKFAWMDAGNVSHVMQKSDCFYTLTLFASAAFEALYHSNKPVVYTCLVISVFFLTAMSFAIYDFFVDRRQKKLMSTAKRTHAIVSSMFPKDVQRRLMEEAENKETTTTKWKGRFVAKDKLKDFLDGGAATSSGGTLAFETSAIADLFPAATIMFADIVGFTAWSSTREPCQVFSLLENIFHEFDKIANHRRVFKVETVGDCYVAVAGLPEPRKDHAVVMVRFARDCLYKFDTVTKQLEVLLGPETSDLGMRFGLHSGPVTAGVLRGERARFQLFGDTMNTASRIETTGQKNKIHISQDTAELIMAHGKSHWCRLREDKVVAKGKGELTTYWLNLKGDTSRSSGSLSSSDIAEVVDADETASSFGGLRHKITRDDSSVNTEVSARPSFQCSDKYLRLVNWNVEILTRVLREMVVRREALALEPTPAAVMRQLEMDYLNNQGTVLDEVKDVITLPKFDAAAAKKQQDAATVKLSPAVTEQLEDYLQAIAALYSDHAFHNFEHASHVTMSVVKLFSRIVAPTVLVEGAEDEDVAKDLHDHTYGITSDPLTQFAAILSALIHDVDHPGVPNPQLVKEQAVVAAVYQNKSIAEQNSVDIAWSLLMQEQYEDLRGVIYTTADEFERFRQLVVNAVMATDIMDKDLNNARKARWNAAFEKSGDFPVVVAAASEDANRKATIVIEHLIQASDIAHTMQHWQIYRKWNARFFEECYKAFLEGRAEKDPADSWYQGEMGFFDFYIIPLAAKLKSCGVFGVSCDEFLNYAQQNRREWESKGQHIVAEMVERCNKALTTGTTDQQEKEEGS